MDHEKQFKEIEWTTGEGTEFSAKLKGFYDEEDNDWGGYVLFDDNAYNWPVSFNADDVISMYEGWAFPGRKTSGTYLLNLLHHYHEEIVAFIQRMRQQSRDEITDQVLEDALKSDNHE